MGQKTVRLDRYSNGDYSPGSIIRRVLWYCVCIIFLQTIIPWPSSLKTVILRIFGARVGRGFVLKPRVTIKYPWFLCVGDYVWIGEGTWIDNMAFVRLGNNVCISQGAYILTNNHNYKNETFDLKNESIVIEDGVWVGAKATVCPGVTLKSHSVLTVGSVATSDTEPYTIYQGNPAKPVRARTIV
jgi:putative colanic acid biosynthesis acetyltransferase WcaF